MHEIEFARSRIDHDWLTLKFAIPAQGIFNLRRITIHICICGRFLGIQDAIKTINNWAREYRRIFVSCRENLIPWHTVYYSAVGQANMRPIVEQTIQSPYNLPIRLIDFLNNQFLPFL